MNPLAAIMGWSLRRPRLIALACLWFIAWGAMDVGGLKFERLPILAPAEARIQTEAPGLVAEQVEALVTRPIESRLIGTMGVTHVGSQSVQGLSVVSITFAFGSDPLKAREAILESLTNISGSLPAGVSAPRLSPLEGLDSEVMTLGFTSPSLDPMTLRDRVQWTVRPRLLSTPGVAKVAVYGGEVRRIEIRGRPADLSDSDLGFLDLINAARRATSVAGAGFIDTPDQRVLIEPRGQALTVEDVGAGQIQTAGAAPVRIEDVADVLETPAPAFSAALVNGRPAVLVEIGAQYGANRLRVTHAVERELARLRPTLASEGISISETLDRPATFETTALRGIGVDLAVGAILVLLALAVILRDPRAVLVVLITLPLSLLGALVALKAFGLSLNPMTLGGLAIGLCVAIDDAVIDVQTIGARLSADAADAVSRRQAVLDAAMEVRAPVVYATLGAIVALVPLLTLRGPQGALLAPLAIAAIATSIVTLVAAVVVTPSLCLVLLKPRAIPGEQAALRRIERMHGHLLARLARRPGAVIAVAMALAVVGVLALATFHSMFFAPRHEDHLTVDLDAPPSTSIEAMRAWGAHMAGDIDGIAGVTATSERIGRDATGADSWGPEQGRLDVALSPDLDTIAQDRIEGDVRRVLSFYPGLGARLTSGLGGEDETSPGADAVSVTLSGAEAEALAATADRVAEILRSIPGAGTVSAGRDRQAPEVRADLNFQKLALYGLSAADVLDTVQAAFAGETVGRIYKGERVIDLAVSAQATLRRDPEAVGSLLLRSTSGITVPLKSVANVYLTEGRALVVHDNGLPLRLVTATAENPAAFERAARAAISARLHSVPGVLVDIAGPDGAAGAALAELAVKYAFASFAVFGLLAIAFDGRAGVLILTSTLLALLGGVAAVGLMGGALSVGAAVGFVAVFALSLRNGILIFGRLEQVAQSASGHGAVDIVTLAARGRLAPVLVTSLLVALVVGPLALHAREGGREVLGPMSLVILGALITGVVVGLVLLPILIVALWKPEAAREADRPAHGSARS